jgi:N-acetylglucosaminyl-diphospho-decaprenol L-rhamnosyltransferase
MLTSEDGHLPSPTTSANDLEPGSDGSRPVVRVIVVTYSPGDSLRLCLESLADSARVPYEVVIVDNGSTDGAPQLAAERFGVRLIEAGRNLGYGAAANLGARGGTAPWLLVINPDTEFSNGSLDDLLGAAERWPSAGVLGPALLTSEGTLYPSARPIPSLGAGAAHAIFGWWWRSNPWTASYLREGRPHVEGAVGWLSGACLLLRRQAFEDVSGFDEQYFMYFEDVDLCERLAGAGWECVHVPSAQVRHVGGASTSRVAIPMLRAHHRSALRYLAGRYPAWWQAALRLAFRAGLLGRYVILRRTLHLDAAESVSPVGVSNSSAG